MSPRMRRWSDRGADLSQEQRPPTAARLHSEGVRALARRELTTLQLREKLMAAGGLAADVEEVLARLREEGALDDRRAARVYAQTAFKQRKRARARILDELKRLGVSTADARDAVDEVCEGEVERRRLEQAVIYAMRGTRGTDREQDGRRVFAHFVRQGYEADAVRAALARAGLEADEG